MFFHKNLHSAALWLAAQIAMKDFFHTTLHLQRFRSGQVSTKFSPLFSSNVHRIMTFPVYQYEKHYKKDMSSSLAGSSKMLVKNTQLVTSCREKRIKREFEASCLNDIHPDLSCSDYTVRNLVGKPGARSAEMAAFMRLYVKPGSRLMGWCAIYVKTEDFVLSLFLIFTNDFTCFESRICMNHIYREIVSGNMIHYDGMYGVEMYRNVILQ
ncbi:MAG: hypothetical protein LUE19_08480 [Clostridiales bacterium]|nr:hypothetical protein [Clostridiales bacterium]